MVGRDEEGTKWWCCALKSPSKVDISSKVDIKVTKDKDLFTRYSWIGQLHAHTHYNHQDQSLDDDTQTKEQIILPFLFSTSTQSASELVLSLPISGLGVRISPHST